jgi:hypothetical protein
MRKYLWLFLLICGCRYHYGAGKIRTSDISRIEIANKTTNKYIADKITLTDWFSCIQIVSQINNLRPAGVQDVKDNFGYYEVHLYFKDGTYKVFNVIYTTYNGVVIVEINGEDKYYKNDGLEERILFLFQKTAHD